MCVWGGGGGGGGVELSIYIIGCALVGKAILYNTCLCMSNSI